ncbi:hypothetical protein [Colwellia piezophila]|uniref:hypothetical protein n=1 Tax=Colwellia piezophila TaxID=211668 RepID=UPI00037081C3|nr:hypothetical protein [Colwellia piezophila]
MKKLLITLLLISNASLATETLTKSEKGEIELLLAEAASKLIYLERDCNQPIDKNKFKELARLKAFSDGYMTIEGISWDRVKRKAHQGYGVLKIEAPLGQFCPQYQNDIKGNYRFLKETG